MKKPILLLCLLLSLSCLLQAQQISYNNNTGQFKLFPIPTIENASDERAKWGLYFWEFGDGNYQITSTNEANYYYIAPGVMNVKVSLTPFYTITSAPLEFSLPGLRVAGKVRPLIKYDLKAGTDVHLLSNTREELVPNHRIRVGIHYKNTAQAQDGYLLLLYNKSGQLGLPFDAFESVTGSINRHPMNQVTYMGEEVGRLPPSHKQKVQHLIDQYDSHQLFNTKAMRRGEERRLFLSLTAVEALQEYTGENRKLTLTAVWIPSVSNFNVTRQVHEYDLQLLKVHDPNRIRIKPTTAYYKKNRSTVFDYRIDFQNEESGNVRHARISAPIDKSLDKSSIHNIHKWAANDNIVWKEGCTKEEISNYKKCFEVDNYSNSDTTFFSFYNIDLSGKDSPGATIFNRRYTKGYVSFSIRSSNVKKAKTKNTAGIKFTGAKIENTKKATIKWRESGLFVGLGQNLKNNFGDYETVEEDWKDRLTLGVAYQNAPIGTGITWGIEANYTTFNMERTFEEAVTSDLVPNGGVFQQSELIDVNFAEFQGKIGYQFASIFRAYASTGISIPIFGEAALESSVSYSVESPPLIQDIVTFGLGIFDKEPNPTIFNQTIESTSFLGFSSAIGLEVGKPNNFSVGIRKELHFYPNFYYSQDKCFSVNNYAAYVRFRLFSFR